MLGLKQCVANLAQHALRAFSNNSNVNSLSLCTWALSSETDELQMAVTDLILSGDFLSDAEEILLTKQTGRGGKCFYSPVTKKI